MKSLIIVALTLAVVAESAEAATRISGTVLDGLSERAVAGAALNVEIGNSRRVVGTSQADGSFSFDADQWSRADRDGGLALLDVTHPNYSPVVHHVSFVPGSATSGAVVRLSPRGSGLLSSALRDSLLGARDPEGRTIGYTRFDLDTAGVQVNAASLEQRLLRRLKEGIAGYLQRQDTPDDLCALGFKPLPSSINLLDQSVAEEAGTLLNAVALIGGELRVLAEPSGSVLNISTTLLPIPSADSLRLSPQRVLDKIAVERDRPDVIIGEAGSAWGQYAAIVLGLREVREWERTRDSAHLLRARDLLAAVQRTLPPAEAPLHRWLLRALGRVDARIRP